MVLGKFFNLFRKKNCPHETEKTLCKHRNCKLYHNHHTTKNEMCYLDTNCYDKQCKYQHTNQQISKKICQNDFKKNGCLNKICHANHIIHNERNILCESKDLDKCNDESCPYTHKDYEEQESTQYFTNPLYEKNEEEDEEEDEDYDEDDDEDDDSENDFNNNIQQKQHTDEYCNNDSSSDATSESFTSTLSTPPGSNDELSYETTENDDEISYETNDDFIETHTEDISQLDISLAPFQELFVGLANSV